MDAGIVAILLFIAARFIIDPLKSKMEQKKELNKNKLEKLYSPIFSEIFLIQEKLIADIKK